MFNGVKYPHEIIHKKYVNNNKPESEQVQFHLLFSYQGIVKKQINLLVLSLIIHDNKKKIQEIKAINAINRQPNKQNFL